jgi:two-component system OmpR family response regulator
VSARERILLVDDNPEGLDALEARLRSLGYQIAVAQDGVAALESFAADAPDLVVLDVAMPELNGYQTCREMKRRDAAVPVLLVSDRDEPADRFWAQQCGADAFLARPLDTAATVLRIAALLGAS